jgi:hypothetical protein
MLCAALEVAACATTDTPTPSATATAVPTPTPNQIDACIVGTWKSTVGMLPQTFHGESVTATGGGGTLLTYNADGSYSGDFAKSQPYTATTSDGHHIAVSASGAVAGSFTTVAGELSLADTQTTLTVTVRVDGSVTSSEAASSTSSAECSCGGAGDLTLSSGGFSTHYVRVG